MDYAKIDQYLDENLNKSLSELGEFCKIPTISAQNLNLELGAELVSEMLEHVVFKLKFTKLKVLR